MALCGRQPVAAAPCVRSEMSPPWEVPTLYRCKEDAANKVSNECTVFIPVPESIVMTLTLNRSVRGTTAAVRGRKIKLTVKCHELPAAQAEDPHGRRLVTLGRRAERR